METPSIRANWSKFTLRHLRTLPPAKCDAIRGEIGDATRKQIGAAGVLAWLPAEHHARIFDAVHKVLGHAGAVTYWADVMFANFEQPLLRPLVHGGVRLFGGTPYAIFRMSPSAWSLVYRDCGIHSAARGDGRVEARIMFERLPRVLDTEGFIAHCEGNCEAVLRFLDKRAVVTVAEQRTGRLTVEVSDVHARS